MGPYSTVGEGGPDGFVSIVLAWCVLSSGVNKASFRPNESKKPYRFALSSAGGGGEYRILFTDSAPPFLRLGGLRRLGSLAGGISIVLRIKLAAGLREGWPMSHPRHVHGPS